MTQTVLDGQVALVTGGGRGIGRAIARRVAADGAAVAVAARSTDQLDDTVALIEQEGGQALAVTVDVTDQLGVEEMVKTVEGTLGPVTLLVNNAGSGGVSGPIWVVNPDEWWRCVDVNLRGPFLCARSVLPGIVQRKSGRIVNVSSGTSRQPWLHVSAYAISKAALTRFTESLAQETQPHHVYVFAVAPGLVHTAMADLALSPEWQQWDTRVVDVLADGGDRPPEDGAELVAMLATGKADVLSGCLIDVSYDLDRMVAHAKDINEGALYRLREQHLPEQLGIGLT